MLLRTGRELTDYGGRFNAILEIAPTALNDRKNPIPNDLSTTAK
jgi:hypothetical protein